MKEALGLAAAAIAIISLLPYIRDTWVGRTRPHLFTWIVWTAMTVIAFSGQVVGGGGAGAWATGVTALLCAVITVLSLRRGERQITLVDWASLAGCALAALAWALTRGPLLSIVLVTLIDALAFGPTLRKSWHRPHEETLMTHELSFVKHVMSIFALAQVSMITAFYPAVVAAMNAALVALLISRRRVGRISGSPPDPVTAKEPA